MSKPPKDEPRIDLPPEPPFEPDPELITYLEGSRRKLKAKKGSQSSTK